MMDDNLIDNLSLIKNALLFETPKSHFDALLNIMSENLKNCDKHIVDWKIYMMNVVSFSVDINRSMYELLQAHISNVQNFGE